MREHLLYKAVKDDLEILKAKKLFCNALEEAERKAGYLDLHTHEREFKQIRINMEFHMVDVIDNMIKNIDCVFAETEPMVKRMLEEKLQETQKETDE